MDCRHRMPGSIQWLSSAAYRCGSLRRARPNPRAQLSLAQLPAELWSCCRLCHDYRRSECIPTACDKKVRVVRCDCTRNWRRTVGRLAELLCKRIVHRHRSLWADTSTASTTEQRLIACCFAKQSYAAVALSQELLAVKRKDRTLSRQPREMIL
eukprot:SAG25_NODE_6083_length_590_cov_0.989817_1_plen_154_part_00